MGWPQHLIFGAEPFPDGPEDGTLRQGVSGRDHFYRFVISGVIHQTFGGNEGDTIDCQKFFDLVGKKPAEGHGISGKMGRGRFNQIVEKQKSLI